MANTLRMALAEVYIRIISRSERVPLRITVRNLPTLLKVGMVAEKRVTALLDEVRAQPHVDREGTLFGRCEMLLGLLCKARKRPVEAVAHLTEARRLLAQLGPTPAIDRVEAALRELQ